MFRTRVVIAGFAVAAALWDCAGSACRRRNHHACDISFPSLERIPRLLAGERDGTQVAFPAPCGLRIRWYGRLCRSFVVPREL